MELTVQLGRVRNGALKERCKEISQRYSTTDLSTGCHWHEQCFDSLYSEDASPPAESFRLTLFREPRSHVLPYMECAFSEWGQ